MVDKLRTLKGMAQDLERGVVVPVPTMPTRYFTLTTRGQGEEEPQSYAKVLKVLANELRENDTPRTSLQLSHLLNFTQPATETALNSLLKEGYIVTVSPPQPNKNVAKSRLKSEEDLVRSQIKAELTRKRYAGSDKGIEASIRYEMSEKGRSKNQSYWAGERGRLVQKAYRLRVNVDSMIAFGSPKKAIAEEKRKLKEAEAQLSKK
jgi:hypothetical protein